MFCIVPFKIYIFAIQNLLIMRSILFFCLLIPLGIQAQSYSNIIYDELETEQGINSFTFSKLMLDAIDMTTEGEDGTVHHITGDLHKVKFINATDGGDTEFYLYKKLHRFFIESDYEPIDFEQENEDNVELYIERKGKHITEVHIIMKELGEGSLISFYGKLKAEELCSISEALNIDACKHLKHITAK